MVWGDVEAESGSSPQEPDASSALHHLQIFNLGFDQGLVDEDRPPLPCAVQVPHLTDTNVATLTADLDPMLGFLGKIRYEVALRGTRGIVMSASKGTISTRQAMVVRSICP